ncbi:MAG: GNAT family N-acetyltransferase [Planctomycetota bacterium]|nr:GNAT family N-acetyltransferase [Planctomycetota bacterium]
MNEIVSASSSVLRPVQPRVSIATRVASGADLPFLDELQKKHSKALGYFPTKQFEGYIAMGAVLVAENVSGQLSVVSGEDNGPRTTDNGPRAKPVGYVISRDRYLKRDELGVIYQLCVAPGDQRKLVGASLIKAVFERAAYGCRLFCCWCAQDLDANYFWESLGFIPIAFRGGSGKKKRVHIFWQRRIREGDTTTPWWFPSKTDQGAMREDRLVLPIPPGLRWSDEMPVLSAMSPVESSAVEGPVEQQPAAREQGATPTRRAKGPQVMSGPVKHGPRQYGSPPAVLAVAQQVAEKVAEKVKPQKKEKAKADPKLVAAARELRDRYLERVNDSPDALPAPTGRYDVSRTLPAMSAVESSPAEGSRALPAPPAQGSMQIEAPPLRPLPSAA